MTLTEFILDRIAEDERDGWEIHDQSCDCLPPVPFPCDCGYPARVLAECEAKRRIVETVVDMESVEDERPQQVVTLRWVCQILALPYADHADYREEWRP